jgi:hypothetical protein
VREVTRSGIPTPESYLGYERLARLANPGILPSAEYGYAFPVGELPQDALAYDGRWTVEGERIVAGRAARLRLAFQANDIFLVLAGSGRLDVLVDGRPVRVVRVSGLPRLYPIALFDRFRRGQLELRLSPGVAAYAFTFG